MSCDGALVSQAEAQRIYDALPASLQVPSLSPAYVAADARRDAALRPLYFVWRRGPSLLMHGFHEAAIPDHDACDWQSPYGYGGPIALEVQGQSPTAAWRSLEEVARCRLVVAEFVRF